MTDAATATAEPREIRTGFLTRCQRAYLWLATWSERNVPVGDDGKHIPEPARRIIETRNFYI